jgi:hypothetical protein
MDMDAARGFVPGVKIWAMAGDVARETPSDRDRVVDFVRSASLVVVVLGHILMVVVVWNGSSPRVVNLLDAYRSLRIATWALQVMPLFFAAGAIANRKGWERALGQGVPWRVWIWGRMRRLMRPVVYYLAVWVPLIVVLEVSVPEAASRLAGLSTQLLWFLGVYVLIVAMTPLERRLARHGLASAAVMLAGVAAVDYARFHWLEAFDLLNFVFVWMIAATLGLVVKDWDDRRRVWLLVVALGALVLNVMLIQWGPYPLSMVGLPGDRISNMAPPTLALAMHAIVIISCLGALWAPLARMCNRIGIWHATCALGGVAMSAYLWHLTALVLVTVGEHALDLDRPAPHHSHFWIATAIHLAALLLAVVALVSLVAPLEWLPVPWLDRTRSATRDAAWRTFVAVLGACMCGVALLVLAGTGMQGFPFGRVTRYAGLKLTPGLGLGLLALSLIAARAGGRALDKGVDETSGS